MNANTEALITREELAAILIDLKNMWTNLGDIAMQVPAAAAVVGSRRELPQVVDMVFEQAAARQSPVTPHLIADKATRPYKSAAFEWLRGMALGTPAAVNDKAVRAKAALALDEWHRCEQASHSATRASIIEEAAQVCEQFMPVTMASEALVLQRQTLENVALAIRALRLADGKAQT